MKTIPLALLLILISTPHLHAQEPHRTTSDYGLRGPVRAVWERTVEYHGFFDIFSENRGRVRSERRLSFDSLGRLVREEERDGKGNVESIQECRWNGDVMLCRNRFINRSHPYTTLSIMIEDSAGYLLHQLYYPDSGSGSLSIRRSNRSGEAYSHILHDSVTFDSTRRLWMPGLMPIEDEYGMTVTDRSSDSSGWDYYWTCSSWDTTAMLWFGFRHDERGRLLESFERPVFGCWASTSNRIFYTYNEHDDLIATDETHWLEPGGEEYDYRYDEHDNWTQRITSEINYLWILPVALPMTKTVRVIEYDARAR